METTTTQTVLRDSVQAALEHIKENPRKRGNIIVVLPCYMNVVTDCLTPSFPPKVWKQIATWFEQNPSATRVTVTL